MIGRLSGAYVNCVADYCVTVCCCVVSGCWLVEQCEQKSADQWGICRSSDYLENHGYESCCDVTPMCGEYWR